MPPWSFHLTTNYKAKKISHPLLTTASKLQTKRIWHPAHQQKTTMTSRFFTTKEAKESKKHCRKKHFTKERPVLSKKRKPLLQPHSFDE